MDHNTSAKRVKVGQQMKSMLEHRDEECDSHAGTAKQIQKAVRMKCNEKRDNFEENNSLYLSESTHDRDSGVKIMSNRGYSVSDFTIFKYCLGGLTDRAVLLKDIATFATEEDLSRLAQEVSLYTGCSHHRQQIMMAKSLIEDGTKVWTSIAQINHLIHWDNAVSAIEEQFMKIACCNTRSFMREDFEMLKRIAGCHEHMVQENFEKIWCWLYPVACTLSIDLINNLWNCTSPKWIEGFITKEEAELSLQGPQGMQEPGTFILRFPTSRSWPHPDAGSLVVTYIGDDYALHHRLLSLDYIFSSAQREMSVKLLQEMLLGDPALSRLGRVIRSQ